MIYTEGNCIFQHDTNLKVQIVCNSGNAICDKDKKKSFTFSTEINVNLNYAFKFPTGRQIEGSMSSTTTDQVTIDVDNELLDANKQQGSTTHMDLIAVDGRRHNRHGSNGSHHHSHQSGNHSGAESDADDRNGHKSRRSRRRSRSRSKSPSHRSKRATETGVGFAFSVGNETDAKSLRHKM